MLLDYLEHSNQLQNSSINETLDSLNITINPSVPISSFFPKLFDEIKTLAKRDSFELLVEIEGTHEAITNSSNDCYKKIDEHINEFDADSEYEIELRVKKHLNNKTISVYFIDAFSEYLNKLSPLSLINAISRSFDYILIFEVFSKINNFGSDSIRFIEANATQNSHKGNISSFDREKKLSLLFDNVTTSNFSLRLLPDDFYLLENSENKIINDIFTNISSILSIVLISNSSLFEKDGSFSYKVSGYKSISEKVIAVNYDRNTCDILYKIYSWSYEGGNSSDKIQGESFMCSFVLKSKYVR